MSEQTDATQGHRIHLKASGKTDVGRRRPHNEDSIAIGESLGLFAVADGMGGHAAGEVASRTAIAILQEFIAYTAVDRDFTWPFGHDQRYGMEENILLTGVQLANRKICQMSGENREYNGMGTTLVALYAPDSKLHICHVGDSRVYRFREGRLEQMTMDHSWVNEQVQRNIITEDEARNHRWRNVITRALGNRQELEADLQSLDPAAGDIYLLCSDGLTGMLRDEEIAGILNQYGDDLAGACDALIDAGNEAGGMDNISVILVQVMP